MADKDLSEQQRKALQETEASLARAAGAARHRLQTEGLLPDTEPHFECLQCDCNKFTPRPGGGGCATPGCGHSFFSHNFPT
jgi:hypothetical protein